MVIQIRTDVTEGKEPILYTIKSVWEARLRLKERAWGFGMLMAISISSTRAPIFVSHLHVINASGQVFLCPPG